MAKPGSIVVGALVVGLTLACQSAYYKAWESVGREKRDLLRSNVEEVQEEQHEASETFQTALDRLREIVEVPDADLERVYDRLSADLERSEARANDVRSRIRSIDRIASDLFEEWDEEIGQLSSADLRTKSRRKLAETRDRYDSLHRSLRAVEASMDPVLQSFRDQVLYLKHNLNASAIGGLTGEVQSIEREVEALVAEMERSIAEAEAFLAKQ